jgi:outer membrane protein assembly factor BamB
LRWRWTPTNETIALNAFKERFANADNDQLTAVDEISFDQSDWPRFRGSLVNGKTSSAEVELSKKIQAKEVWRHKVGPSWGSLIHVGGYLFTMEQRGDQETVVCLKAETGQEIWSYGYDARFVDMTKVSGVGPRSTPTFHKGVLYSVGGLGQVSAIHAIDGTLIWKRNLPTDTKGCPPEWGYSTSAFVDDQFCIVLGNGEDSESVDTICYDSKTGDIRWAGVGSGLSYSSPQVVEIFGKRQVLSMVAHTRTEKKGDDIVSRDYESGELLWRYRGQATGNAMVTPVFVAPDRILMGDGSDGAAMLQVSRDPSRGVEEWSVKRVWSQNRLLPEFSDFVVQPDRVLGLSKGLLTALNIEDGKLLWKKFRFGGGQIIGLKNENAILAIAESGNLSLIKTDSQSAELLLEWEGISGKTWNHPILIGNRVYARNSEEIACHELVNN